jgi:conjugal transfer pilus assembly protein TrbC
MPEKSLQAWLLQCKQSGATPVIRGLIHNSFKDTMTVIQTLSKKTGIGMQLDPILFKTFDITEVPAVVYVKDTPACPANMNCKPVNYDSLYGDVSLDYALEKMRGEEQSEDSALNRMILQLRGDLT